MQVNSGSIVVLLSVSVSYPFISISYKWNQYVAFIPGFFHLAKYPWDSPLLLHVLVVHFYLLLNKIYQVSHVGLELLFGDCFQIEINFLNTWKVNFFQVNISRWISSWSVSTPASRKHWSAFCHDRLDLSFIAFNKNGIIMYVYFCTWIFFSLHNVVECVHSLLDMLYAFYVIC